MAKVSVEQELAKAKSHTKKGEVAEARSLYATILKAFPNNKKAQQGLTALGGDQRYSAEHVPSQAVIDQLISLYRQGRLEVVVGHAKDLTAQFPKASTLWNILGASSAQIGKLEQALIAFKNVIAIKPNDPKPHNNIGNILKDLGKLEEAVKAYNKAVSLKPDYAEAYLNMGNALHDQSKLVEAVKAYNKAISLKPNYSQAYLNMGNALFAQGKLEDTLEAFNKALSFKPDYAEVYYNMGIALADQGKLEEAIEAYNKALAIKPDYAEAYNSMGNALKEQGKLEEAIQAFTRVLAIKPDYAEAYNNMGVALQEQGKLEEAIEAYNKALAIKPDYAEAHLNMSFACLAVKNFEQGFAEYEWRWKTKESLKDKRYFSQPLWNGKTSLKGKRILLWCEHGVGDTINWSSRLPLVSAQADHCILECPEKLVPLMDRSFPNIEVKPEDRNNDEHRTDFDYHLPLGSLYCRFAREILNDTKPNAFLLPDPIRVEYWTKRLRSLGEGPYLGVSWKSANMSPKRLPNYAPLADWSPIFTIPNVTFINLQYTDFIDDLIEIQNKFGVTVHNFDDLNHYDDLDDVAALCAALDVVVSTKITVPLISAGVGTATKLANWRQSSWNNILLNPVGPLVDIFEKNTWEPWGSVFELIAKDINP